MCISIFISVSTISINAAQFCISQLEFCLIRLHYEEEKKNRMKQQTIRPFLNFFSVHREKLGSCTSSKQKLGQ